MHVTFNFDPNCPWTWLTSRWLVRAAEKEGFEVRWGILSLAHVNRDNPDVPEQYRPLMAAGRPFHRIVAKLLEAGDQEGVGRFYEAYGDRRHRKDRDADRALVLEAANAAGVDAASIDDESLDAADGEATDAVVAAVGGGVGSPVLSWDGPDGPIHVFGPIIDELPDPTTSVELWRGVRSVAEIGAFAELKRGRGEPQLSTS